MSYLKSIYFASIFMLVPSMVWSQAKPISIEEIMKGEEFVGYIPEDLQALPNGNAVFTWKAESDSNRSWYEVDRESNQILKLSKDQKRTYPLSGYEWSTDKSFAVYSNGGHIYKWNVDAEPIPLVISTSYCHQLHLSKDDRSLFFVQGSNLFEISLTNSLLTQLTNFKKGSAPLEMKKSFLEQQQIELFEQFDDQDKRGVNDEIIPVIYYGDGSISEIKISPNEKFITFKKIIGSNAVKTVVQSHITADGYTENINARPKVGREDNSCFLGVYNIDKQEVKYFELNNLSKLNAAPNYYTEYDKKEYTNRGIAFHGPYYNDKGDVSILEVKSQDNKHRWLVRLDLAEATFEEFETQHSDAWIGGPGISGWNEVGGNIGWLKNRNVCYFQSEETGFSHLYTYDFDKKKKTQLTSGEFEIHEAYLNGNGESFYVLCNKNHPGNRTFWELNIKNQKLTPIFTKDGRYDVVQSSIDNEFFYLYSYRNTPTELYFSKKDGTEKKITNSLTSEFAQHNWMSPDVVTFQAKDGKDVYARLYKATESKENKAVIFVHGAGYLQNAHNWWSLYFREFMFHNFLVQEGYTVLDIDYRASEGYGRDWRTGIYRHMGGLDLSDQLDGRDFLINEIGIDSNRIGIYGGSYGGFITLMALLTEPGKFKCGAALRSVTDWAHYNHEYTSNILNTPEEDPEAFKRSSPIYFAENLSDPLLMLHGMIDDNVQFQDVVRLSQRFIELGKDNWELAVFPVEAHGFKTASSWTDEYKRIFKLFEENLGN